MNENYASLLQQILAAGPKPSAPDTQWLKDMQSSHEGNKQYLDYVLGHEEKPVDVAFMQAGNWPRVGTLSSGRPSTNIEDRSLAREYGPLMPDRDEMFRSNQQPWRNPVLENRAVDELIAERRNQNRLIDENVMSPMAQSITPHAADFERYRYDRMIQKATEPPPRKARRK